MRAHAPSEDRIRLEPPSSRRDEPAAGWYEPRSEPLLGQWEIYLDKRRFPKWDTFSWLTVRALLESANDVIAKRAPTIIRDRRRRYVAAQRAAGAERSDHGPPTPDRGEFGPDFVIDWTGLRRPRFLLVGDPGEADASQYATIDPIREVHRGEVAWDERQDMKSDFMVVLSDVIYPAGDINDYVNGFYIPFKCYDRPIYAIPGNHDWYDGLNGFMFHHCRAEPLPRLQRTNVRRRLGERLVRGLWQTASKPERDLLAPYIQERARLNLRRSGAEEPPPSAEPRPVQPAPYFAIELDELIVVAIDTGVGGALDSEQGEWLLRISARDKPKVLLTGKPIWVNSSYRPGRIAWGDVRSCTVDDIVRDPSHRYVAAIGGDTHNFQRYPVRVGKRTIQYIVSGGGGAYLSATHTIPRVEPPDAHELPSGQPTDFTEEDFRCYPLRGDSLALFCRRAGPVLVRFLATLLLVAGVTAALVLWLITIDGDRRLAALLAAVGVAGLLLVTGLVLVRLGRRTAPGSEVNLVLVVLIAAAGVVAVLLALADRRATVAVAVALAVPLATVLGVLIAYVGRGSLPTFASSWVLVAPLLALPPALWAPYELSPVADALLYGLAPLVAALVLVVLIGSLRRDLNTLARAAAYRATLALAWLALAAVVVLRFGETWMERSLLVVLGLAVVVVYGVPLLVPRARRRRSKQRLDAVGPGAGAAVAVSLAGLALVALDAVAGPDGAEVAAAGTAAVSGVLAALGAVYLLVPRGLIDPRALWYLRRGEITPAGAAAFVARRICVAPTRAGEATPGDRRRKRMANVIWRLGNRVAEIAQADEPPFYKSFLSLEVDAGHLEISCWGVTGYADPSKSPSLEDRISIPLESGDSPPPVAGGSGLGPRRHEVRFRSEGVECCAWHYPPRGAEPAPCVVLAHGFDGVRDQRLHAYAKRFAKAGLAALVFDYRYFGDSKGDPRQLVSNRAQLEDWRAAIACARGLDGVDERRIALWGTSTSGGHVVKVGAEDTGVAAVVCQMPFASGFAQFNSMPVTQSLRLVWAGLRDQVRAWIGAKPLTVPAVGRPYSLAVTTTRDAVSGLARITPENSTWRNEVLARFALRTTFYSPGRAAKRLCCPLLVCIADGDRVMPAKPALKMAEHGTLRRYGFGHFAMYYGEGFKRAVADQVEFLRWHLLEKPSRADGAR
jgi:alpha/beta superfamily hydrolase